MLNVNLGCLDVSVRTLLCKLGISVIQFVPYQNFVMQAEKVKQTFVDDNGVLVPCEAREHALRALVEKYVKLGLKREVLCGILSNVMNVKLGDQGDEERSR